MAEVIPERLYDAARREGIDVESEEQLAIWAVWCCADSFPDLTVGDFRALRAFAKERRKAKRKERTHGEPLDLDVLDRLTVLERRATSGEWWHDRHFVVAGRSASWEFGWCSGSGKDCVLYLPQMIEPELMYGGGGQARIAVTEQELIAMLGEEGATNAR
jgi:hypothetical protein